LPLSERPLVDPPASTASPRPARESRWRDLAPRVWSALALVAMALVCVSVGGYMFLIATAAGSLIIAHEWVAMTGFSATRLAFWFPTFMVATTLATTGDVPGAGLLLIVLGTVGFAFWARRAAPPRGDEGVQRTGVATLDPRGQRIDEAAPNPGAQSTGAATPRRRPLSLALGFPYIGLAAIALPWLRDNPISGLANILFVLAIVWGSDIGAYVVGRIVGGPKLAPAISPGKTWSGAAGGLASAVLAALGIAACLSSGYSPSHVMELAIGLGIVSQAGDLLESALKRRFGVKDSGHLIPGHGGLLDRLDALLAVAPVATLLAFTVGRGEVLWH
jgi:phosphatidate cytidylyltransferase